MTSRSCAESSGSVLAVEDSEHFDQRAKINDYDDFVFLVV
jgi:Mg2+ and Co2+ transporter CorA